MNEKNVSNTKPVLVAQKKRATILSAVWLIPLLALLVGIWLLVGTLRNSGPNIVLYTDNADGLVAGATVIKILNVEVGRITDIHLNEAHNGVELEAQMRAEVADLLKRDTRFWVVKPRIDESGITGLNTLVSGAYLEMAPGVESAESKEFTLLETPPVTSSREGGTHVRLHGEINGLISVGSPVLYRNVAVGKVESARVDVDKKRVEYQIFVAKPNDVLLGSSVNFWLVKGVNIHSKGGSINIDAPPIAALLSGAIVFSEPKNGNKGERIGEDAVFTLYSAQSEVPENASPDAHYFVAFFDQSIASLAANADVRYKGIDVGKVAKVPYFNGDDAMSLLQNRYIPVQFYLDPLIINAHADKAQIAHWQTALQAALKRGLSVSIASDNLIMGSQFLQLSDVAKNEKLLKPKATYGDFPVLGSKGGGLDALQQQLNQLLHKFNQLPLDKTLKEINGSLNALNRLLNSQEAQQLPRELRDTLQNLQQTLAGVSPDSPMYQDLQHTLRRVDETLNRVNPVLRTLNDKPNALIFNGQKADPVPKGNP